MNKELIIEKANEILATAGIVVGNIDELLSPKDFNLLQVWEILTAIIRSTEEVYSGISKAGSEKHLIVKEIWNELDEKYHIIDRIDDAIKLPWWIESFDGKVIRFMIDQLISLVVTTLNQTGVFKH